MYGTLADFDRMVKEGKKKGVHIILDFVLNHTSDQHPWFIDSHSSRTHPIATGISGATAKRPEPAAQQLDFDLRRLGVEVRRQNRPVLLSLLLSPSSPT